MEINQGFWSWFLKWCDSHMFLGQGVHPLGTNFNPFVGWIVHWSKGATWAKPIPFLCKLTWWGSSFLCFYPSKVMHSQSEISAPKNRNKPSHCRSYKKMLWLLAQHPGTPLGVRVLSSPVLALAASQALLVTVNPQWGDGGTSTKAMLFCWGVTFNIYFKTFFSFSN